MKRKVKLLSLMAGAFQPIDGNRRYQEYNVVRDVPSCRKLAERWPTPMAWSGFEIGIALPYPADEHRARLRLRAASPAWPRPTSATSRRRTTGPTWDLTSVLFAVLGDRGYFEVSPPGRVTIDADGSRGFESSARAHRYLVLRPEQKPRVLEALVQLSSQPPQSVRDNDAMKSDPSLRSSESHPARLRSIACVLHVSRWPAAARRHIRPRLAARRTPSTSRPGTPRIALIMKSLANEFFKTMADGAKKHQTEHAADYRADRQRDQGRARPQAARSTWSRRWSPSGSTPS